MLIYMYTLQRCSFVFDIHPLFKQFIGKIYFHNLIITSLRFSEVGFLVAIHELYRYAKLLFHETGIELSRVFLQASECKKTQKEIGDIAGVAEVTIRQSYKLMYPRAKELFPEGFEFVTPVEHLPQL